MKKILVFGASSRIAQETIKHFNLPETHLFLAGSDDKKLEIVKADLNARNSEIKISTFQMNALEFDRHQEMFNKAIEVMGGLDCVFIAHGTLPDQEKIQYEIPEILKEYEINCTSVISLSSIAANIFEKQGNGSIAVISSVAGERGRQSNYIYGSAKGAVSLFLQGLRNRMFKHGVHVTTIKPGIISTPMTSHLPKGLLMADPKPVGKSIHKAIIKKKDEVFVPGIWKHIMLIIRNIPESIFKKLSL